MYFLDKLKISAKMDSFPPHEPIARLPEYLEIDGPFEASVQGTNVVVSQEQEGKWYSLFRIKKTSNPTTNELLFQVEVAQEALENLELVDAYQLLLKNFQSCKVSVVHIAYDTQQNVLQSFNYRYNRRNLYRLASGGLKDVSTDTHRLYSIVNRERDGIRDAPKFVETLYFGRVDKNLRFSKASAKLVLYNKTRRNQELRSVGNAQVDKERLELRTKSLKSIEDFKKDTFRVELQLTSKQLEPYKKIEGQNFRVENPRLLEELMSEYHIAGYFLSNLFMNHLSKTCQFFTRKTNVLSPFIETGVFSGEKSFETLAPVKTSSGFRKSSDYQYFLKVKEGYLETRKPSYYEVLEDIVKDSAYSKELREEMPERVH